jgi:hypothetical protein
MEEEDNMLTWIYMVTEDDADLGMLQNVGGYYEVVKTNLRSLKLRRCVINNLTYNFLKQIGALKNSLEDKKLETVQDSVKHANEIKKCLTLTIKSTTREEWKDFKLFLTRKFLTMPEQKLKLLIQRSLSDIYNTNYTEYLLHKARFIYKQKWNTENMEDLIALRNSLKFGTQLTIDSKEIVPLLDHEEYSQSFYKDIMEAIKRMTALHSSSFVSFSTVTPLPLYSNLWSINDFQIYNSFLQQASSISYIDVNMAYDISYISK